LPYSPNDLNGKLSSANAKFFFYKAMHNAENEPHLQALVYEFRQESMAELLNEGRKRELDRQKLTEPPLATVPSDTVFHKISETTEARTTTSSTREEANEAIPSTFINHFASGTTDRQKELKEERSRIRKPAPGNKFQRDFSFR
jgi:hypothetical protein